QEEELGVVEISALYFNTLRPHSMRLLDVDHQAAIALESFVIGQAFGPFVAPVVADDIVLVRLLRVKIAVRMARADNDAIADGPGVFRVLGLVLQNHLPTCEILTIKEVDEAFILCPGFCLVASSCWQDDQTSKYRR